MPHSPEPFKNYVPHDVLVGFTADIIIDYMSQRLTPIIFKRDHDVTRQAIRELLDDEDMSQLPIQKVYEMAHDLIADYLEHKAEIQVDYCAEKDEFGTCIHSDHTP